MKKLNEKIRMRKSVFVTIKAKNLLRPKLKFKKNLMTASLLFWKFDLLLTSVIFNRKKYFFNVVHKVLMQRRLFQMCTHFLYCSLLSLGGKVNTRRMSQPDKESIFTKIIYELFWSKETIMWIFKIIKIKCLYPPRILDEH